MKLSHGILPALFMLFALTYSARSQGGATECYLGESIISQVFNGCDYISKSEIKYIYFFHPDYSFPIAISLSGYGQCCGNGPAQCWPQFMESFGFSSGCSQCSYWRGRWAQTVYSQGCETIFGWGQCYEDSWERYHVDADCPTGQT